MRSAVCKHFFQALWKTHLKLRQVSNYSLVFHCIFMNRSNQSLFQLRSFFDGQIIPMPEWDNELCLTFLTTPGLSPSTPEEDLLERRAVREVPQHQCIVRNLDTTNMHLCTFKLKFQFSFFFFSKRFTRELMLSV